MTEFFVLAMDVGNDVDRPLGKGEHRAQPRNLGDATVDVLELLGKNAQRRQLAFGVGGDELGIVFHSITRMWTYPRVQRGEATVSGRMACVNTMR